MKMARVRFQYCKVIIATSMVWIMFDVFVLMYFTDCTNGPRCNQQDGDVKQVADKSKSGFLQKIFPKDVLYEKGILNKLDSMLKDTMPKNTAMSGRGTKWTKLHNSKYSRRFKSGEKRGLLQGSPPLRPGDGGQTVKVPPEREAEAKETFKINQFNLVASDMMALNRTLPDYRMDACKKKKYPPLKSLPKTSIVIVFHNEAWSTLLRTVHSIIDRSPYELLEEIILVDDASEREHLGSKLEEYIAKLPVSVHVLRTGERIGLIRARLKGAHISKGQVITFLDAHCECTEGWLEPLLSEIHNDRTAVVCPIIDVISDETFEYITGSDMTWGGFNWKLNFRWYQVPQRELDRRGGDRSQPTRTPTMAGGLFAIDRDYFYEMGSYDEGMDIWGGENLEMSFRIWMCGGKIYIVTCSRVGHVFRKTSPYSWPGGVGRIINHNTQRIVEVWMDEYSDFFYQINPNVRATEYGDVSNRKKLRQKLNCKSFRWFLEHVYPESQLPIDYHSLGEIRNKATSLCLDTMGRKNGENVGMERCHGQGGNQVFCLTKNKQLMTDDDMCITVDGNTVRLVKCATGNSEWHYDKETKALRHVYTNQCLGKPGPRDKDIPSLSKCTGSEDQQWILGGLKEASL